LSYVWLYMVCVYNSTQHNGDVSPESYGTYNFNDTTHLLLIRDLFIETGSNSDQIYCKVINEWRMGRDMEGGGLVLIWDSPR